MLAIDHRPCQEPPLRQRRASFTPLPSTWLSIMRRYTDDCYICAQRSSMIRGLSGHNQHAIPYLQPVQSRPFRRRRVSSHQKLHIRNFLLSFLLVLFALTRTVSAAFIGFENCLPENEDIHTKKLQWTPLFFNVKFDVNTAANNLNITTYGNVSGSNDGTYEPPDSPIWTNLSNPFGKIVNATEDYTTLFARFNVLSYLPYEAKPAEFCTFTVNQACPIGPVFKVNASENPDELPGFTVAHDMQSPYSFATIVATLRVVSGDTPPQTLACVSAAITPDLGKTISRVIRYLPLVILILVGFKTAFAAIFSPWGTLDPFKWTSNYGRDEDLLRLVTPGFADCLQYVQFVALTGSLSLQYPGYYQPVISKVSWSALLFNNSFVTYGNGTQSLQDGVYTSNGTYGLDRMSQLVGMTSDKDMWAGSIIWTLVIIGSLLVISQLAFFARWGARTLGNNPKEDLRQKNWPFLGGMLVRIVCEYFLLPIVALSLFQLVISGDSPAYLTVLSALLVALILIFAVHILRLIFKTKPRSRLFDDLPTVLLYGPLYNTYSDDKAPFALIPALLTFMRGVAIGAVQASGVAQIVILVICEVILMVTLSAFRPFHSPTSMNSLHTIFSSARLVTVLLSIAFVPSLGISEGSKGYVGYVVLLLHALVMIFGFFLNALQTILEVSARLAGAGGEGAAAARGGLSRVLGVRQLSRRQQRSGFRQSMGSEAAMLTETEDVKGHQYGGRSRSMSASSAILLNTQQTPSSRVSGRFDQFSATDMDTAAENGFNPFAPNGGAAPGPSRKADTVSKSVEPIDPYYRPPRPRKLTSELMGPGARSRASRSVDWNLKDESGEKGVRRDSSGRPMSTSPQNAPSAAYLRQGDDSDPNLVDSRNVDYAVREVDFYYGVRGPALSSQPTRKLKTGPADPVGPVSSATGWFKGLFGGKAKDNSKGFEVVRSSRAPPVDFSDETTPEILQEPYLDKPQVQINDAYLPGQRTRSNDEERERGIDPTAQDNDDNISISSGRFTSDRTVSNTAPYLAPIDVGGGIELLSRFGSRASKEQPSREPSAATPPIPRRSSQRHESDDFLTTSNTGRLSTLGDGRAGEGSSEPNSGMLDPRVPFTASVSPSDTAGRTSTGAESTMSIEEDHRSTTLNTSGQVLDGPALIGIDRPTSYGQVSQFRASDSIHTPIFLSDAPPHGSRAEFVETTPRASLGVRPRSTGAMSDVSAVSGDQETFHRS